MYKKILVPIDGSETANAGLAVACVLAEHHGSKIILLCVTDEAIAADVLDAALHKGLVRPGNYRDFLRLIQQPGMSAARSKLARRDNISRIARSLGDDIVGSGASFAKEQHVPEVLTLILSGVPEKRILDAAREYEADLIVIGSRGQTGIDALFDTSVAEHVRKRADCPCLVLFGQGDS